MHLVVVFLKIEHASHVGRAKRSEGKGEVIKITIID